MWPPSSAEPPLSTRLARTTIASAFQRISAASRSSIARSPGNGGCSSSAMRVDVRRHQRRLPVHAAPARMREQRVEDEAGARRAVRGGQRIERFAPFGGLGGVGVGAGAGENRAECGGRARGRSCVDSAGAAGFGRAGARAARSGQVDREREDQARGAEQIDLAGERRSELPADPGRDARREAFVVERNLVLVLARRSRRAARPTTPRRAGPKGSSRRGAGRRRRRRSAGRTSC